MTIRAWQLGIALGAFVFSGCSDPVPPAPRGNLRFNISQCGTNYSGGIGADPSADITTQFLQLPDEDGTDPGRRLEDGQAGTRVQCTVDGGDFSQINARIDGTQSHPSATFIERVGIIISNGFIERMLDESGNLVGGEGTADITLQTGGLAYQSITPCTLSLASARSGNQFTVDAGRVYAKFYCADMSQPPVSGCVGKGAFVFERCAED